MQRPQMCTLVHTLLKDGPAGRQTAFLGHARYQAKRQAYLRYGGAGLRYCQCLSGSYVKQGG